MFQKHIKFINPIIYKIKSKENHKMQIQSLTSNLSYSTIIVNGKANSSVGTQATSEDLFKKKISLCSCSSSISLEQNLAYTKQKEIFAKYLFAKDTSKQYIFYQEMCLIYQSYQLSLDADRIQLFDLSKGQQDQKGKVLSYFVSIWLKHMGYGSQKNKKYLLSRVKLFFGHAVLGQFTKIYQNLSLLDLPKDEKLDFLLGVCKNGWEYFVQQLSKRKANLVSVRSHEKKREISISFYQNK